jgi:hypothetical protein
MARIQTVFADKGYDAIATVAFQEQAPRGIENGLSRLDASGPLRWLIRGNFTFVGARPAHAAFLPLPPITSRAV